VMSEGTPGQTTEQTGTRKRRGLHVAAPTDDEVQVPVPQFHSLTPGRPRQRSTLGSPLLSPASVNAYAHTVGGGDIAAGPRRHNSLSEAQLLPWLCCMFPALSLWGHVIALSIAAVFSEFWFQLLIVVINWATSFWFNALTFQCLIGWWKLHTGSQIDWIAKFEALEAEDSEANEVMHVIILPNYSEKEEMLLDTLTNLARSPLAQRRTRVVLAMEAREGQAGRDKAERLIQKTQHLFTDIFASYHPPDIPGEVAGKSSNTQWAYRAVLRRYGPTWLGCDTSRIFITVGDADTSWHPHYLSAVACKALEIPRSEREWTIFQPPVLLSRNYWSVPGPTRVTMTGGLVFEVGGLGTQAIWPHFAFSTYTVPLALASHPEVDGWDGDVIAEDHHMTAKCFFAALWGQVYENEARKADRPDIKSRLRIQPVYLPALNFLVEGSSHIASLVARFEQSRRHCFGQVEMGYIMLQWLRISQAAGFKKLTVRTHLNIFLMLMKLFFTHVTGTTQALGIVYCAAKYIPKVLAAALGSGQVWQEGILTFCSTRWALLDISQRYMMTSIAGFLITPTFIILGVTLVLIDVFSGHYYRNCSSLEAPQRMDTVNEDSASSITEPSTSVKPESVDEKVARWAQVWWGKLLIAASCWADAMLHVTFVQLILILIPGLMAAWSILVRRTSFEYIVAPKPD